MFIDRLQDLLKLLGKADVSVTIIEQRLRRIYKKLSEALMINMSSEKLISFLIEDFLDLG